MNIQADTIVRRQNSILFTDLGYEIVFMDTTTGTYFNTKDVGRYIWAMIETPHAFRDICATLADHYDVDEAICQAETQAFVERLNEAGLVILE